MGGGQISNLPSGSEDKRKSLWREGHLKTDLHVLCLALQRELQLADDGVLLPQRSVQVVLHVLLGPLQVLQGVRQMLQLHVLLFDHGVEALEGTSGAEVELKFERRCLCDSFQTKTQFRTAYVDGFLAVGEQVVESIKVALPLSKGQLQLVDLVVLLLNGGELLIQRLLRAMKCREERQNAITVSVAKGFHRKKDTPPEPSPFLSTYAAAWRPHCRCRRDFCFAQSPWSCLCTPDREKKTQE